MYTGRRAGEEGRGWAGGRGQPAWVPGGGDYFVSPGKKGRGGRGGRDQVLGTRTRSNKVCSYIRATRDRPAWAKNRTMSPNMAGQLSKKVSVWKADNS